MFHVEQDFYKHYLGYVIKIIKMSSFSICGKVVDVFQREIFDGEIVVRDGKIISIAKANSAPDVYILPGLIDSHVHIESSMLMPSRFARLVIPHGTVAVVTDPHEIANVMGVEGVQFMIEDGKKVPLKFFFGAPSCVPATPFESSGAVLNADDVTSLLENPDIYFLSEMMNFPGVINEDPQVLGKIAAAKKMNMRIDGHAPGLKGDGLKKYIDAGVETDHECATFEEAKLKIDLGMKIQIREGSAARNFNNLAPLLNLFPDFVMLCTDDSHPDEILNNGHIDRLIKLGLDMGIDIFNLLRASTVNPVLHYNLPVGLLRVGDPADFIVIDSLDSFDVKKTFINGQCVYDCNEGLKFPITSVTAINNFRSELISLSQLKVIMPAGFSKVKVIEVKDGDLLTSEGRWIPDLDQNREVFSDPSVDVLKLVVVNRYTNAPAAVGFARNIGLKSGALASSVAHDSHNIVAVGVDDQSLLNAINTLIDKNGGIVVVNNTGATVLELPVAGLMSLEEGEIVAGQYQRLNKQATQQGSWLKAPFMALSFLSLLVIPDLKLSDRGLFDVNKFGFTSLFE